MIEGSGCPEKPAVAKASGVPSGPAARSEDNFRSSPRTPNAANFARRKLFSDSPRPIGFSIFFIDQLQTRGVLIRLNLAFSNFDPLLRGVDSGRLRSVT